jgi:glycosyltransferase involved in cell wall biosynthesis
MGENINLTIKNGKRSLAIIPCYNEEFTIASIIIKAKNFVDEVLVIDDGSTDDTAKIAKNAGAKVVSHRRNEGKTAGIRTGFTYALANNFDYVITLDGDAQHNPNEIPLLLNNLRNNGSDIILGIRFGKNTEMPLWRKFGKRILDYTTSLGNGGFVTDSQCGFRAFNRRAIENLVEQLNGKGFSVESEQLIRAHELGLNIGTNNISCKYKYLDTSTKGPTAHGFSVLSYLIKLIAIKRPLLFIGVPGFILVLMGLIFGIQTLQFYNQTNFFNIGSAILVSTFLIIGALGVFVGLILNILPNFLDQSEDK